VIGLDTNILVRYIAQDDVRQSAQATALIESLGVESPGFVALVTVVELVWVLSSCYDLGREELAQALASLLRARELVVDRADLVTKALRDFKSGKADFADCLIASTATAAGCELILTFDIAAAKSAGMTLIRPDASV
jgi:predicted nucleic-acid-binding protein